MALQFLGLLLRLRPRGKRAQRPISSLSPGWAVVRGRACAGTQARRAPISGRQGLGWRVLVEQECGFGGWEPVVDLCEFEDFQLQDHSGSIRVRASDSPLTIDVAEQRGRGGPFAPPPFVVAQLIVRAASPQGVLFHKGFRWREWVLEEGREIIVRGRVISEPGDESTGYRELAEVLVLAGGTARPLELAE
jgi:hypothetical protein